MFFNEIVLPVPEDDYSTNCGAWMCCIQGAIFQSVPEPLLKYIEDLTIRQLIPELTIKALIVTVLPRTARFNIERPAPNPLQPPAGYPGCEFW